MLSREFVILIVVVLTNPCLAHDVEETVIVQYAPPCDPCPDNAAPYFTASFSWASCLCEPVAGCYGLNKLTYTYCKCRNQVNCGSGYLCVGSGWALRTAQLWFDDDSSYCIVSCGGMPPPPNPGLCYSLWPPVLTLYVETPETCDCTFWGCLPAESEPLCFRDVLNDEDSSLNVPEDSNPPLRRAFNSSEMPRDSARSASSGGPLRRFDRSSISPMNRNFPTKSAIINREEYMLVDHT